MKFLPGCPRQPSSRNVLLTFYFTFSAVLAALAYPGTAASETGDPASPDVTVTQAAQNSKDTELEPVIVSAVRSPRSGASGTGAITVVTRHEIEASGASNLAEVLRGRAGVQIADFYGNGSRVLVSMRGFGDNAISNTLVLVDGRRLNNPDMASPELAAVSLKDIERIEIVQGSAGTLFGDQAVGGVINIITRTPDRLQADVSAATGSYDSRQYIARFANALDNGISFRVSAEDRYTDNYRVHNEIDYNNVLGRLDYTHESGAVFLDSQTIREQANLPGGLFHAEYDADRRQPRYPADFANTRTDANRFGLRQQLTPAWRLEAELARRNSDIAGVLSASSFTQDRRIQELTPRLIGTRHTDFGNAIFTLGVDQLSAHYDIVSMFGTTDAKQNSHGVYAQAVVPTSEHTTITVGARRARVENNLRDSFAFPTGIRLSDSASAVEAGLSWQLDSWRFYARRDGNFRFAKIDEQTATLGGVVGLKTQTGRSHEAGTEWAQGGNTFKTVLYRLDLDNEIDYDTTTYANVNLDPTRRDGLLIEASQRVSEHFVMNEQYGHVNAYFRSGPFQDKTVPFVADRTLRLTLEYRPDSTWFFFGEIQSIGSRVASSDISNTLDTLPGHRVVNAAAQYRVKRWVTALRINNLTNRMYADYAAGSYNPVTFANETAFYAAPERNLRLQVQYELR